MNKNILHAGPNFSAEGGLIATDFEFFGGVSGERNTDGISGFTKMPVDSKGKRETAIRVRNAGCLVFAMALLSACGGVSSDVKTPATLTTRIKAYTVVGSGNAVAGKVPVNANINGGAFHVNWDVDSSDPYHAELYLSADDKLDTATDIDVFGQNCGSVSVIYNCGEKASFDCRFGTDNKLSCGKVSSFNRAKDLTTFLDRLPKTAWLMLKACNALLTDCKTAAVQIELQ